MALKIEISIKITRQRVEALVALYVYMIEVYEATTHEEHLIHAHAVAMHWRLEAALYRKAVNLTIVFSEPEAIAFCLFFDKWAISDPLARIAVLEIMAAIDKKSHQPTI